MLPATSSAAYAGGDVVPDGTDVVVTGRLSDVTRKVTSAGAPWASATLEDPTGTVTVLLFPHAFDVLGAMAVDGMTVYVRGRVVRHDDGRVGIAAIDMSMVDVVEN